MLTSIKAIMAGLLVAVLSMLPESPFSVLDEMAASSEIAQLLRFVNWFVPINTFVAIMEGWLICVAVYYVWQVVLRWLQAVE